MAKSSMLALARIIPMEGKIAIRLSPHNRGRDNRRGSCVDVVNQSIAEDSYYQPQPASLEVS